MKIIHIEGMMPLCTNSFLLIGENGNTALIDPACTPQAYAEVLKANGAKLTHILLTHGHYDHAVCLAELKNEHGAKIYMSCSDAPLDADQLFPVKKADCDHDFADEEVIEIDDFTLKIIKTPGHSAGSVCLYLKEENVLFTGDTVFKHEIGRCDLPSGNFDVMLKSLKKLQNIFDTNPKVLPGHGEFSTLDDEILHNPYFKQI